GTAGDSHWTDLHQDAIVLALLLECADDFVAGGVLCDKLDVPRAELLKRIDSLRARGYVIHTRGGLGYRLVEIPDQLGDAQIAPLLASGELGRKISGLLTELRAEPDRVRHAVLGVGVNVSLQMHDFPEELRPVATSLLLESGERQPRPLVCARLLEHIEEWLSLHETEGFGPVADRWRELSSTLGRRVRITGADPIEGDAVDLAEDGALLVRTGRGALVRGLAGDGEHCTL